MELREGSWHGQKEFGYFLERVLPRARVLSGSGRRVLVRLDGAHDARENRERILSHEGFDFLIKWNPRQEDPKTWLDRLEQKDLAGITGAVECQTPREGKRVATFSQVIEEHRSLPREGEQEPEPTYKVRRIVRITERTIDRRGQALLIPEVTLEGWWTCLDDAFDADTVIGPYRDHATSEQFHSELKSDLDLERLPSGKFDTNDLVLTLGAFTYNILRWIGLAGLTGKASPVRHPAKRRRIRTVMQELMYVAARLISSARQYALRFSCHCPGFRAFDLVYHRLAYG